MNVRSTLRRTPVRPVNVVHQVVPDDFAETLRLLRHLRDPRLPMTLSARTVNGATPAGDPRRELSKQFTAELAAAQSRGVSVYMIARQLGVSDGAIRYRLGRHGYMPLPPSMRDHQYKGRTNKRINCKRGHPLFGDNLGTTQNGRRWCRACERIRKAPMAATIAALLLLAKHRPAEPAGEPLGHRRDRPHHPDGWHQDRDEPATPAWPGGRRPELRDNLPKES